MRPLVAGMTQPLGLHSVTSPCQQAPDLLLCLGPWRRLIVDNSLGIRPKTSAQDHTVCYSHGCTWPEKATARQI